MKKSVEIIGQPVISITEGKEFGNVKELLINYADGTIAALVIDDGKWYLGAKLVPFNAITGLGESAVTINNSADIVAAAGNAEFEKLFEAGIKVIGTKVLTKGGKIQGKINEILIDNSGKIDTCEMENTAGDVIQLSTQNVVTFGKEVLIVTESNEVVSTVAAAPTVESIEPAVQAEPVTEPVPAIEVAEVPVEQVAAPEAPIVEEAPAKEQPVDDSAKKFDDKHRKFLLGKKASRRIETDNGMLIVEQGGDITEEVLQKAKLAGKFVELSMNIQ